MQAITPVSGLEMGGELFPRTKPMSFLEARTSPMRPTSQLSEATEIFDTDFEDESDYGATSAKGSFESYDSRRRSQTTISSYDEARTPSPRTSTQSRPPLSLRIEPVQGPRGPHLFRSSQVSADFDYGYALQMSPLLPKDMSHQSTRAATAFSEDTVTQQQPAVSYSLNAAALRHSEHDPLENIRSWSTQEVCDWMYNTEVDPSVIESFYIHDIDGSVLVDLQFEDLKELDIPSFGKRHQLWNAICMLKGEEGHPSPRPTPFQDISRPCTSHSRRSPDRGRNALAEEDDQIHSPTQPPRAKSKRRGRKPPKNANLITPAESISIVAIEQLLPKPHKCAKGERCAKWRKQQRELEQLQNDHGIGRFPISPTKGGHIFMAGNPGNAITAENMIPHVKPQPTSQLQGHLRLEDPFRPVSDAGMESAGFPSVVASSDVLGPGQLPEFTLHEDVLSHLGSRDPQDNVKQFLQFQHMQTPVQETAPPSPPYEMFPSQSICPFPAALPQFHHYEAPATAPPPPRQAYTPGPRGQLNQLPKLEIPRSQSAGPQMPHCAITSPQTAGPAATPGMYVCRSATASPANMCRSATASPGARAEQIFRLGTPSSVMDVPTTQVGPPAAPLSRDTSQSVPPNMQFRPQAPLSRSKSRTDPTHWRRPSMALPVVQEGEVFSPGSCSSRPSTSTAHSTGSIPTRSSSVSVRDPAKHSPVTHDFGYGPDCSHSGWMRKRKTKMLRHEWTDSHFRLKGTQLTQHASSRLSAEVKDSINVDDYAVACSSVSSQHKLSAAFKALAISKGNSGETKKDIQDATAFAFQLVPSVGGGIKEARKRVEGKTHHFAVKTKDERIDWMRELMLAKAREQKGKGFEVEVNGQEV